MRAFCLSFFAVLLIAGGAGADPVLDRAHEREKAGDLEASASLLASWLSANPSAVEAPGVFADYLRVEQDFPLLLDRASTFLKTAKGLPGAAAQFESIARLFDLAGRVEQARDAFLAAHAEGGPDATLISAFLLSLRMNDADAMAAALQRLSGKSASAQILLQALSDLHAGHRPSARAALIGLAEQTGNPDLALKALWVLYEAAGEKGDASEQAAARQKLGARFASSPENALAAGSLAVGAAPSRAIVVSAPAPGPLDPTGRSSPAAAPPDAAQPAALLTPPAGPTSAAPPSAAAPVSVPKPAPPPQAVSPPQPASLPVAAADPAPAAAPATPTQPAENAPAASPATSSQSPSPSSAPAVESPRFSVQAGSFQMKENADDLCAELGKRGFTPVVVHDVAQGKDRYRVLAGSGLAADGAKDVLTRLSAAGFAGYMVQDR